MVPVPSADELNKKSGPLSRPRFMLSDKNDYHYVNDNHCREETISHFLASLVIAGSGVIPSMD